MLAFRILSLGRNWSMAASSPASNNSKAVDSITAAITNGSATPQRSMTLDPPKQNLRGLNKPKCIKCGNVARSRCPFQCCKSCCSKAQNPCHIHVLKQNGTLPDKPPPSSSPSLEQPSTDAPSTGSSWRLNSLRQLSTAFANSLRSKKPLTRKDAANVNKWRFMKLKEHIEGNIEVENEAFDRYMQNVSLLEETFSVVEGLKLEDQLILEDASSEDKIHQLVSEIKVKLKSNVERADSFRERIQNLINQKLRKLQERELFNDEGSPDDEEQDANREFKRLKKVIQWHVERYAAVNDLMDKLNRARSEDDLKSCLELKNQLFNHSDVNSVDKSKDPNSEDKMVHKEESDSLSALSSYSLPMVYTTVRTNQAALSNVDAEFSSLGQIAQL
ncbi:uncharacterized protein [Elaeis guineensis]|uniref:uncharacterized protein isoform X2 n=1 Tax=Elaeis guineensis var. tenera TaxID=51953 RepID=UPI003C6D7F2D